MQNPYDAAPLASEGDLEDSTVYEAVGRALSQWEVFEGTLGRLFAGLCGVAPFRDEGATRAYGVVSAFTGRCDMLEAALAVFPRRADPDAEAIAKLIKTARSFGARRNEIAHGIVSGFTENSRFRGHYLVPAYYNSRKREVISLQEMAKLEPAEGLKRFADSQRGKYAYTAAQINEYRRHFLLLHDEANRIDFALFWKHDSAS
jgi:hypothetical protein